VSPEATDNALTPKECGQLALDQLTRAIALLDLGGFHLIAAHASSAQQLLAELLSTKA
jgi:hypothetical protein